MNTTVKKKQNTINRKQKKSLRGVIALLILLPPVGLTLFFIEFHKNYEATRLYGTILTAAGAAAVLAGGFSALQVRAVSYGGRAAVLKALSVTLLWIPLGVLILCAGIFYLKRDAADHALAYLICNEKILNLSDLSILMSCSRRALLVRIDRMAQDSQLPGITVLREGGIEDGTNKNAHNITAASVISQVRQKHEKKFFRRDLLWIAAAFFGSFGGIFYYPATLLLTAAAWLLERKYEPRNYRSIFLCACFSFTIEMFILYAIVFYFLDKNISMSSTTMTFLLFYPGLLITGLHLAAYVRLSSRNSMSIRALEAVSP